MKIFQFPKIRFAGLVICMLIVFQFTGFVKDVFADYEPNNPNQCIEIIRTENTNTGAQNTCTDYWQYNIPVFNESTLLFDPPVIDWKLADSNNCFVRHWRFYYIHAYYWDDILQSWEYLTGTDGVYFKPISEATALELDSMQTFSDLDPAGCGPPPPPDECPNDPLKTEPGICGCGVPDTDTDGGGVPDCNDGCVYDPDKTEPGVCGCGTPDVDMNFNGIMDCNDDKNAGPCEE